jgi:hypothetical protein
MPISRTLEDPEPARTRAHIIRARTWVAAPAGLSTERHPAHVAGPASRLQNDLSHAVGLHLAILRGNDDSAPPANEPAKGTSRCRSGASGRSWRRPASPIGPLVLASRLQGDTSLLRHRPVTSTNTSSVVLGVGWRSHTLLATRSVFPEWIWPKSDESDTLRERVGGGRAGAGDPGVNDLCQFQSRVGGGLELSERSCPPVLTDCARSRRPGLIVGG